MHVHKKNLHGTLLVGVQFIPWNRKKKTLFVSIHALVSKKKDSVNTYACICVRKCDKLVWCPDVWTLHPEALL